jgi:phosphoribosylformylglycinamidine synthase
VGDLVRSLILSGVTRTVHDLSDGGLVAAAVEMALASGVGMALGVQGGLADHAMFFGEDQARYLIAVPSDELDTIDAKAAEAGVDYLVVGEAGGDEVSLTGQDGLLAAIQLDELRNAHEGWMPAFMGDPA